MFWRHKKIGNSYADGMSRRDFLSFHKKWHFYNVFVLIKKNKLFFIIEKFLGFCVQFSYQFHFDRTKKNNKKNKNKKKTYRENFLKQRISWKYLFIHWIQCTWIYYYIDCLLYIAPIYIFCYVLFFFCTHDFLHRKKPRDHSWLSFLKRDFLFSLDINVDLQFCFVFVGGIVEVELKKYTYKFEELNIYL